MRKINKLIFVLCLIITVSCGGSMSDVLSKSQFKEKWDSMLMNSSEMWWYAGSNDDLHFIAIETPFNTSTYSVGKGSISINNIEIKEFSSNKSDWVILKTKNIKILE